MSTVVIQKRSPDEWMALITEARQSGLTDAEWCRCNGVSRNSFYSAIKRLRKRACSIPGRNPLADRSDSFDPVPKQEVVRVGVVSERPCCAPEPPAMLADRDFAPSPCPIEISSAELCIRISNHADPLIVASVIDALRRRP